MNLNRIKMLEDFIKEEPENPFNFYALAMEFLSEEPYKAKTIFDDLLVRFPEYVPTYYQAAGLYAEIGESEQATKIISLGMQKAINAKDTKAHGELQGLLNMID